MCWSQQIVGCWGWFVSWGPEEGGCYFLYGDLVAFQDPKISTTWGRLLLGTYTHCFFPILILLISWEPGLGLLVCCILWSEYFLSLYFGVWLWFFSFRWSKYLWKCYQGLGWKWCASSDAGKYNFVVGTQSTGVLIGLGECKKTKRKTGLQSGSELSDRSDAQQSSAQGFGPHLGNPVPIFRVLNETSILLCELVVGFCNMIY